MKLQNLFILVILASVAYLYVYYMYSLTPFAARPNTPIPQFNFQDINGKNRYLRDFDNKTIIINFWATWCAPCVQEFPRLVDLAERNPKRVVVIALSSDKNDEQIRKFLKGKQNTPRTQNMIIARDAENITGQLFHTYKLPETLVIDRNLNLRKKFIGSDWTIEDIEKAISRL